VKTLIINKKFGEKGEDVFYEHNEINIAKIEVRFILLICINCYYKGKPKI